MMIKIERILKPLYWHRGFIMKKYKNKFKECGENFIFGFQSIFLTPELLSIGDNVFIGDYAYISAEVKIGNNVMFGPKLIILGGNHYFAVKGKSIRFLHPKDHENREPITIEDEIWCGASVIILGGVRIGMGGVIGAGSVVTKELPPYVVAVGNPCKPVKKIFTDDALVEHLAELGKTKEEGEKIKQRRIYELEKWNLENLPIIDRTSEYWDS